MNMDRYNIAEIKCTAVAVWALRIGWCNVAQIHNIFITFTITITITTVFYCITLITG